MRPSSPADANGSAIRPPIPPAYALLWERSAKAWPRDARMLALMAETGWSCRLALSTELVRTEPKLASVRAGSIQRLWTRLQTRGLIRQRTVVLDPRRHVSVSLVELTPYGRELLYQMGIPRQSVAEWQLLRQHHDADGQLRHTAMVVLVAHYFRQRGFTTVCCPPLPGRYAPDLALQDGAGTSTYVEVEAPSRGGRFHKERLLRKWEMQRAQQGFVAFCTLRPSQRDRYAALAGTVSEQGLATDLITLSLQPDVVWSSVWSLVAESLFAHRSATVNFSVGQENVSDSAICDAPGTPELPQPVQGKTN